MEDSPREKSKTQRWLILVIKIAVTAICLWYVSGKIDFKKAGEALQKANWLWLAIAFLLYCFSKLVSAIRLNIYFNNIGIHLPTWQNIKLYWLGMFYNLFLPGSIGGDAYKVILLSKRFNKSYKKTTTAVLLDRVSGLAGLGLILSVYSFLVPGIKLWAAVIALVTIVSIIALYFLIRSKFTDFLPGFSSTLFLGIIVQAIQVIAVYLILQALNIHINNTAYIFLFLVSSIVSVLPLTIGGLGAREIIFLEGSRYFGLLQETSVLISLLFYVITLFASAIGTWYVFNDPIKRKRTQI